MPDPPLSLEGQVEGYVSRLIYLRTKPLVQITSHRSSYQASGDSSDGISRTECNQCPDAGRVRYVVDIRP